MLSVKIKVLQDNQEPIDGYSQGHITFSGEYGSLSTKSSVMVFISLCQLLYCIEKFITTNQTQAELPLGIDSGFEPWLFKDKDNNFSFMTNSQKIINKSSQQELTEAILKEAERIYNVYVCNFSADDSVKKDLHNSLLKFQNEFAN